MECFAVAPQTISLSVKETNETQRSPPSFSQLLWINSFVFETVSFTGLFWNTGYFDHIFFFVEIPGIYHTIDLSCIIAVLVFVFYYTFKIVQLSPVLIKNVFITSIRNPTCYPSAFF